MPTREEFRETIGDEFRVHLESGERIELRLKKLDDRGTRQVGGQEE